MENKVLCVRTLGTLSMSLGDVCIDDSQNRSKKVWALLAFLMCNHHRAVPQSELIDLLWADDKDGGNPVNSLKTTLHRARALLDSLAPGAGHEMIVSAGGGYAWNSKLPIWLDIEEFETRCREAASAQKGEDALEKGRAAIALYGGEFLTKLGSETWVLPQSGYYRNLYLQVAARTMELMEACGYYEEAEALSSDALKLEPYQEEFYQCLMRSLIAMGKSGRAAAVYEDMSRLLLSNFGVMPDRESRELYRQALRTVNDHTMPAGELMEQLREQEPVTGTLFCDYDFFRFVYQSEARRIARSGVAVHIALINVSKGKGEPLPKRSLEPAMDNLQALICSSLRTGDVVSRCSPSQFIIMLPQANYENSLMVCSRIEHAFFRRYPHSPAVLEYTVYPLQPNHRLPGDKQEGK